MGLSSSSLAEGGHFADLVNPPVPKKSEPQERRGPKPPATPGDAQPKKKKTQCMIDARAAILQKVSWEKLWEKFLSSTFSSFALSSSEAATLLREAVAATSSEGGGANASGDDTGIDAAIEKYIELVDELEEKYRQKNVKVNLGGAKVVDFMALVSSVLLLSSTPFEDKIDQLFRWITLSDNDELGFQDFIVAMSSFERGLSNAMGFPAGSEAFVLKTAKEWLALADPSQKGAVNKDTVIKGRNFFEFCSNRQHVVRKLLEILAQSEVRKDKNSDVSATEAVTALAAADKDEMVATGGDEWMANPAWKKTAEKMVPKNLVPNNTKPTSALELEWVHGYRGFDCRNNLAYVNDEGSQFFFFAAALGVCQDSAKRTQKFFGEHSDDIISMAVYRAEDKSVLIATGEMGKTPAIQIYEWKNDIFTTKATVRGFHAKGVCQLAFSKDGKTLFSVGVEYTVAIITTDLSAPSKFGKMALSSQGPKDKILSCCYAGSENGTSFVSCGEKHSILWSTINGALVQSKTAMAFSPKAGEKDAVKADFKNKMYMAAVPGLHKATVLGTSDGDLITLSSAAKDKQVDSFICSEPNKTNELFCQGCVKLGLGTKPPKVQAHNKAVNALWSNAAGDVIVSGCAEGKVIVWSMSNTNAEKISNFYKLEQIATFDNATSGPGQQIRAVCVSKDLTKLLVGTAQSEVVEFKFKDSTLKELAEGSKSVLVNGHFRDELWGLAVRPLSAEEPETNGEYCTVGDDGYLRIWSVQKKCQLSCLNLKEMARCCAYSPDGQYIAVGFGGSVGKGKNPYDGTVRVYRTWKGAAPADPKVAEFKEAKAFISCIRFSPDGTTLAVGARDNSIYLYSVTQNFKRKAKFSKHNAGILFFDFTADGKFLQSCCSGYEILFSDTATGVQNPNGATLLTDAEWATWTCTLGWATIGIWAGGMDGTDVNACERSPSGKLLALGDDFGKVKVYRFPATQEGGSQFNAYSGHSSHVTNTRWATLKNKKGEAATDDYLLSLGGNDKCVFQWRNTGVESGGRGGGSASAASADEALSGHDDHAAGDALDDGPSGGDEFTAVKPWLGAIVAPSAWAPKGSTQAQKDTFQTKLGDLSLKHATLTSKEAKKHGMQASIYADVQSAARAVRDALSVSGVEDSSAPTSDELELEWVHGYRGHDCRNNVFYVDETTIIYHAAALGVSTDLPSRRQKYFRGHTDDIMSMAVRRTSDQLLVATGQQAIGNTYVWDAKTLKTLAVLQTKQKSINMLEFSKADEGRLLVSIAEDKSVAVCDWKSQTVLANTKGEAAVTYQIAAGSQPGNFGFMSVGDKHLKLWSLNGRNLTSTKVLLGTVPGPGKKATGAQTYWCVVEAKGQYFVGAEDAYVYIVSKDQKTLEKSFCASKTSDKDKGFGITALLYDEKSGLLLTGAKCGTISGFAVNDDLLNPKKTAAPPVFQFNVDGLLKAPHEIMAKQINGLAMKPVGPGGPRVLLVSTRGCDLLQVDVSVETAPKLYTPSPPKGYPQGVVQRAHCNDEVWGLCTHPTLPQYVTVGDDKTMRFYCIKNRTLLRAVPLGLMSRTVCYHPAGNVLALGFGGRVGKGKEAGGGIVRLYSAEHSFSGDSVPVVNSDKLVEAKDAKEWISDVKFSSDGRILCAGAHDCKIYIYTVSVDASSSVVKGATLTLAKTFAKHNSVINHLDLSADGRFMQSNCSAYELLFCDTQTGKQITSATELKDVKWDTWTCTLGWPVQGIWAPGMDGSDINAVSRSHSGHLLATSDDFGKVKLFRSPCVKENSPSIAYGGHSSHVTCVRWSVADECLISTGGNDKCVFQWRHRMCGGGAVKAGEENDWDDDFAGPVGGDAGSGGGDHHSGGAGDDEMVASGGDESGCVKPWLGAVRTPKNPPPVNPSAPAVSIDLKWVHGYTSAASGAGNVRVSNNLFYGDDGSAIFPAAALGVVMKKGSTGGYQQKYFTGMNDDILCLAISPNRSFVATGQTASKTSKGKGSICVWDARDCRLLCRMDGCHQRGVVSLAFSPEGNDLMSVGQDDKNTHILWTDKGGSWSRVQQVATAPSDQNAVLFGRFLRPDAQKEWDIMFTSGGAQAINFWKLEGATLVKKTGRFGKAKQAPLLCAANLQQPTKAWAVVVGTAAGDLYVYSGKDREAGSGGVEKAHASSVLCLTEGNKECTFLVSGGKDRVVRVWNQALQRVSSFDLTKFSVVDASVASVDVRPLRSGGGGGGVDGGAGGLGDGSGGAGGAGSSAGSLSIIAGTYGGEIVEITSNPEKESVAKPTSAAGDKGAVPDTRNMDLTDARAEVLLHSHYSGELWGCAAHPVDRDLFASAGDDGTLRLWSVSGNRPLAQVNVNWPARSVAWHPSSTTGQGGVSLIAVGFMESVKGGVAKKGGAEAGGGKKAAAAAPAKGKAGGKDASKSGEGSADAAAADAAPAAPVHDKAVEIFVVFQDNSGAWIVRKIASCCDSAAWIGDVKWSSDGRLLAAGSHDKKLYAFEFPDISGLFGKRPEDYATAEVFADVTKALTKPKYVYNKHSSSVNHFDFSLDGKYFQSNCQAAELLFAEAATGKQETSATKMAEYHAFIETAEQAELGQSWDTQTCVLGWSVQGIWPPGADTSDINACDRSRTGKLLATADDFGSVKLFRYPCVQEGAKFVEATGHSSHVTCVRFNVSNDTLISTGGNDKCVFVWSLTEK